MRLELNGAISQEHATREPSCPEVLRIALSQRNLLAVLIKLDDLMSHRRVGGTDVRCYFRDAKPDAPRWVYDERGWSLWLQGIDDWTRTEPVSWHVAGERNEVICRVNRQGVRQLLHEPFAVSPDPFDETVETVICEADDWHYRSRGFGPGLMIPEHEQKMQELCALPGVVYGPLYDDWRRIRADDGASS